MAVVVEENTIASGPSPQHVAELSKVIQSRVEAEAVSCPRLQFLILLLEGPGNGFSSFASARSQGVNPALLSCTGARLDHIGWVGSNVEAHEESHIRRLHFLF